MNGLGYLFYPLGYNPALYTLAQIVALGPSGVPSGSLCVTLTHLCLVGGIFVIVLFWLFPSFLILQDTPGHISYVSCPSPRISHFLRQVLRKFPAYLGGVAGSAPYAHSCELPRMALASATTAGCHPAPVGVLLSDLLPAISQLWLQTPEICLVNFSSQFLMTRGGGDRKKTFI